METVLITAGVLCLMAAAIGRGVKVFGAELPALDSGARQGAVAGLGAIFLALALWKPGADREPAPLPSTSPPPLSSNPAPMPSVDHVKSPDEPADTDAPPASQVGLIEKRGFIYLGMRDEHGWLINRNSPRPIIEGKNIPRRGSRVNLVGSVHLRRKLPSEDFPTSMEEADDMGVLDPGDQVLIGTVSIIDNRYYWASVIVVRPPE